MSQDINIKDLRQNYETRVLEKNKAKIDPFKQFKIWFDEVLSADFIEPNAMNLATVNKDGVLSSRMVLLKTFDVGGFIFFTNYNSSKAQDLKITKSAALNFWWDKMYRQVRIQGHVERVSSNESKEYFHSRPRGSQIGAIASQQSSVIENYKVLEEEYNKLEGKFIDQEIPYPDHWGGYRVIPDLFEFWQGRPNRLHDRLRYVKTDSGEWKIDRLSP